MQPILGLIPVLSRTGHSMFLDPVSGKIRLFGGLRGRVVLRFVEE